MASEQLPSMIRSGQFGAHDQLDDRPYEPHPKSRPQRQILRIIDPKNNNQFRDIDLTDVHEAIRRRRDKLPRLKSPADAFQSLDQLAADIKSGAISGEQSGVVRKFNYHSPETARTEGMEKTAAAAASQNGARVVDSGRPVERIGRTAEVEERVLPNPFRSPPNQAVSVQTPKCEVYWDLPGTETFSFSYADIQFADGDRGLMLVHKPGASGSRPMMPIDPNSVLAMSIVGGEVVLIVSPTGLLFHVGDMEICVLQLFTAVPVADYPAYKANMQSRPAVEPERESPVALSPFAPQQKEAQMAPPLVNHPAPTGDLMGNLDELMRRLNVG